MKRDSDESRSAWRDANRETGRGFVFSARWIIAIILFIGAITIGIWFFNVATSDIRGAGDAEQTKNSSTNRIAQQEAFQELYNEILSADKRVDLAKQNLDSGNGDPRTLQTEYSGAQQYCLDVTSDYNAKANSFRAEDFRDTELPARIDATNPTTDCKENVR